MSKPENPQAHEPDGNGLLDRLTSRLFRLGLGVALVVILLDQLSKWAILKHFEIASPWAKPVFPGFKLVLVFNKGVSFGQFDWLGPEILSALAIVISTVLVFWLRKAQTRLLAVALGFVIGGAIGNVIDRLRFDAVVDFLDFYIPGTNWPHWPAFNVADSAIVVGVGLIILEGMFAERAKSA